MKSWDIAIKDLRLSFRSYMALVFMFVIPILVTSMFYIIFRGVGSDDESKFNLPLTPVHMVNLDAGSQAFSMQAMEGLLGPDFSSQMDASNVETLGDLLVALLQSPAFEQLLVISSGDDVQAARALVESQQVAVAIILPENFSAAIYQSGEQAVIEMYQDPTLTIGPGIVKAIISQILENMVGIKIGTSVTIEQLSQAGVFVDAAMAQSIAMQFLSVAQAEAGGRALLDSRQPSGQDATPPTLVGRIVTTVMGGMMVFYAFFTAATTAESILKEQEDGTLPRLMTTPTTSREILTGKFISVSLTVFIQIVVLMLFGRLVFGIRWGSLGLDILFILGTVAMCSALGLMLVSFLKNSRQAGMIFGGVMTVTGMLGMMNVFTMGVPNPPPSLQTATLFVPQGWAVRSLLLAIEEVPLSQFLPILAGMALWSIVFFSVGNWRLQRKFG